MKLPRSPNVDEILSKYHELKTKKDGLWVLHSTKECWLMQFYYLQNSHEAKLCIVQDNWFGRWNLARNKVLLRQGITCAALIQGQYQEAIVDDVSPSTVYGAEHLLRLFGKISVSSYSNSEDVLWSESPFFTLAVKLPDLFSYVNMEEETWSRMQQTLLRLHQVSNLISSPFSYHFGRTVKFTITLKPFTGSFRRILEFRNFLMNS